MKITKRQLRRIIKEQHDPRQDPDYDPLNPDEFAHESPEDDMDYDRGLEAGSFGWPRDSEASDAYHTGYDQGEMDAKDPDSEMSIEYAEEFEPRREGKMKLTKRQLKKIIKEEKRKLLREGTGASVAALEENLFNALDEWVQAVDEQMGGGVPQPQLKGEVMSFVDGYFADTEYAGEQAEREEELASQGFKNPSYG